MIEIMLSLVLIFSFKLVIGDIFCSDYYTNSTCYDTEINDERIYCFGSQSCELSKLIASFEISCSGYRSCQSAENITTPRNIQCTGEYSCDHAEHLSGTYIACRGGYSCANVDSIKATNSHSLPAYLTIACDGDYGCYEVNEIEALNFVFCRGNYGCYGAGSIKANKLILCHGEYSCADIDNQIEGGDSIFCYGSNSCINAPLIISQSEKAAISCISDNACKNVSNIQAYYVNC